MRWLSKPIREGVNAGLSKGLTDFFTRDRDAAKYTVIPPMPEGLNERIKWAAALWRDAKKRSGEDAPSVLGRLVAAGEMRILAKLLIALDAERHAAKAIEARSGETERLDPKDESAVAESHSPDTPKDSSQ